MSQLALQRIREAKENRLTRLDIGNCGLTEIPDEVFELVWLEELIVSNDWWEYSFEKMEQVSFNSQNKGEANNLKSISPKMRLLKRLIKIFACGNIVVRWDLSDLSPLTNLTTLQELWIPYTQVSDLSHLTNLTALKKLDIESTEVSDLSPLTNLTALQMLKVSGENLSDLSPLTNLIALQILSVSGKKVSDLSPLTNLTALQLLNIGATKVSDLSPLTNLTALQKLSLGQTQVSDLSPLPNLTALQKVNISFTKVSDLSPLKKIIEKGITVKWGFSGDGILVANCPLSNPPREIVRQGNAAILRYWQEQDRIGKKKVNEARLLLVGQGQSGKTTLKDKLKNSNASIPKHDATTLGIDIERIICKNTEGDDFTVQVWDFGGQNIQKYAHQFFMSDSVVYAVLSNTREQNPNFQYWLNIIELLGKNSPFFIVQNEKDGHAESLKDITQIQERFPHTFKSVEQVNLKNAATDPRFEILKQRLFYAATQLPHTQKEYLVSFINVREQLEALSKTQQTITFKQFRQLCKTEGIEDTELMNDYARTFTLLGIALHFADDVHLKTQVFLRPKWIIDALFAVLYADIVETQHGKFSTADAAQIWQEEEYEDMHGVLLQLMVKFHLCYEIPNTKDYIVPQRLQTRLEAFVPPTDATHIVYRYRFLPSGILTQLTCRLHQRIEDDKVWNDAVQFSTKNGQGHVFVRENSAENHLELFGFGSQKADLINTVVDTIDEIHLNSKFGNLKVEKLVPCPCPVCANKRAKQEDAEFFDYDFLIELLQEGETESDRCKLSKKKFPIKEILKNASIHVFKIEQIRKLLERDKTEEALNILRGALSEDDEVIIQLSRLSRLNRNDRTGQLSFDEANRERNKIIKGVLEKLTEWEADL